VKHKIDPKILFVCRKTILGELFDLAFREYKGSIVIDISSKKLKVKTSLPLSIQHFLDKTGRIFVKDSTREEVSILTNDELLLKLRLENLAQKVWLQASTDFKGKVSYQILIQDRPYPDENCLLPIHLETK